jgi:hypothetical protein
MHRSPQPSGYLGIFLVVRSLGIRHTRFIPRGPFTRRIVVPQHLVSPVPLAPFYWQPQRAEALGLYLVARTREKIDLNLGACQATSLALQSSIHAVRASRERILHTDVLLARLWGQKEP